MILFSRGERRPVEASEHKPKKANFEAVKYWAQVIETMVPQRPVTSLVKDVRHNNMLVHNVGIFVNH